MTFFSPKFYIKKKNNTKRCLIACTTEYIFYHFQPVKITGVKFFHKVYPETDNHVRRTFIY